MKQTLKEFIGVIVLAVLLWISLTSLFQSMWCPEMTQTEIFLNIPNSVLLKFDYK